MTVALSGDGGDENFGGYRRYRWHLNEERVRSLLPLTLRRPVFGLLGQLYPKADWAPRVFRAKSTLEALARNSVEAYFHSVSILHDGMRRELFSERFRGELQGYAAIEVLKRHAARAPSDHPLSLIQYLDLKTYLVGDINTKVDRASMAHSLEVREPLMDHPLVEWLAGPPPAFKVRGGEGKYLLKKALEPYLPPEILYRAQDGLCGSPRPVVPRAAAPVGAGRRAGPGARRYRLVQRGLPAPPGRRPPVGAARLQRAAVDSAHVRIVPAQRDGRSARAPRAGRGCEPMNADKIKTSMHVLDFALRSMRVIHILDHSVPLQSGYAFRTLAILKEQRALGWETFQLTGPKQGPAAAARGRPWTAGISIARRRPGGILEGVPGTAERSS